MGHKVRPFAGVISALVFLSCATQAYASMKEIKTYKEAFPGATVKCVGCHSAAMPKKDNAGLNGYGKAMIAANPHPTAETLRPLGKAEDFSGK